MKNLVLAILLIFTVTSYAQLGNLPNVGTGFGVLKGTTVTVDSLDFQDGHTLLLQDNSTLIIREKINGNAIFTYGDVGDDIPKSELVELPQTLDGIPYMDYRETTDVNPKLIFEKWIDLTNITIGPYIDVTIPEKPEDVIANAGDDVTILSGDTVTLTANGLPTSTYQWSSGQTTQSITVSPTVSTLYTVIITDLGGSDEDSVIVRVNN